LVGSSRAPRLIVRGDLLAALEHAVTRRVTIISAPAGSGKTSLLRAWAEGPGRSHRLALLQVQRDQQDAQQFWLAVLDAVGQASGAQPPVAAPTFNGQAMVDRVISELAGHPSGVVLVVDDLHELRSPEALAQLTRLLTNLPAEAHAVLATRREPRLRLHQLRLAGELAEIRAADLCFSERETRELLTAAGIALPAAAVALLHQRTEGWAAGLRLAAIALADHHDPERFVAEFSGSNRTVAEYLLAEMLDRQPPEVQHLLLRTSLLDRVNGELAGLLTGRPGAERILLDLEDANAFVVSLDPQRTWFRYHHLFGDLLRLELRRTMPEEVPGMHRLAAAWFTQHGRIVDAVRHRQSAGDWTDAAELLADHSFSLMLDGRAQTMQALLRAFPAGAAGHPELALVRALVELVQGHLEPTVAHLAAAEAHIRSLRPERQRRLSAVVAALKVWLARRRGQIADAIEQATVLVAPLSGLGSDDAVLLDSDLRAVTLMNLGTVEAWSMRQSDGERHLHQGAVLARRIGRPYIEVGCLAQLGFASAIHSLALAQRHCEEAIALAEHHGWGGEWMVGRAQVILAGTMLLTGEFDEAGRRLDRARQILQADSGQGIWMLLHMVSATLHAVRRHYQQALQDYAAAEDLQSRMPESWALASQVTGWKLATQARLGSVRQARASLAELDDQLTGFGEIRNARAVICLVESDPAGALDALRDVLDGTAPVVHACTTVEAHLLDALAHHELGEQRAANQAVEHALTLAEADRLILPFTMTGSAQLLKALPRHQTAHAALLADILDVLHGSSRPATDQSAPAPTEPLSPSELKILRYLPTNLSRPQIAAELSVSVNTVNTHVRNIYAKLQANGRTAAIQRARQLGLLSAARTR
jgi:LuxR family transcriptional regulator, maltose regulon positive regulatory protein